MTILVAAHALSAWRIAVHLDAPGGPSLELASSWSLVCDAGRIAVARAWYEDAATIALALDAPLVPHAACLLECAGVGGALQLALGGAPSQLVDIEAPGDPEAEALALDVDWFGAALDALGDTPTERGEACLRHDLVARVMTDPGELVHQPTAGVGIARSQNGPSGSARASQLEAAVRRQVLEDDRVEGVRLVVSINTAGIVRTTIHARSRALGREVSTTAEHT
jgi:hypothetical protein